RGTHRERDDVQLRCFAAPVDRRGSFANEGLASSSWGPVRPIGPVDDGVTFPASTSSFRNCRSFLGRCSENSERSFWLTERRQDECPEPAIHAEPLSTAFPSHDHESAMGGEGPSEMLAKSSRV